MPGWEDFEVRYLGPYRAAEAIRRPRIMDFEVRVHTEAVGHEIGSVFNEGTQVRQRSAARVTIGWHDYLHKPRRRVSCELVQHQSH